MQYYAGLEIKYMNQNIMGQKAILICGVSHNKEKVIDHKDITALGA